MAHTSADKRLPATKPVFEFLDYRKYLLHYYKQQRSGNGADVLVGIAVTSHVSTRLARASFNSVAVR